MLYNMFMSHNKCNLEYHLVLVCKYRKNLFLNTPIKEDIISLCYSICSKHNIKIVEINTDRDHLHMLIKTRVNCNLSDEIRTLKSYTTYHIWRLHPEYLRCNFWKEKTFWSDGYYISSVGLSETNVRNYIKYQ